MMPPPPSVLVSLTPPWAPEDPSLQGLRGPRQDLGYTYKNSPLTGFIKAFHFLNHFFRFLKYKASQQKSYHLLLHYFLELEGWLLQFQVSLHLKRVIRTL